MNSLNQWIAIEDQEPPTPTSDEDCGMLCFLNDNFQPSFFITKVSNAAYWAKHKEEFSSYTHWLMLPERPSKAAGIDPCADCALCHPELRDENWVNPMEALFGSAEDDREKKEKEAL